MTLLDAQLASKTAIGGRHRLPAVQRALEGLSEHFGRYGVPLVALMLPAFNALISAVWLQHSMITLRQRDVLIAASIFLLAAGLCGFLVWLGRLRPLAAIAGSFAVVYGGFAATSLPSALGVANGWPLWDGLLLRADALMGFDHPALLEMLTRYPLAIDVLRICYGLTVPMVLMTGVVLVLLRRYDRLRELNGLFAITVTLVVGASTFFTAAGMLVHAPVDAATLAALPAGAGVYHMQLFEALRSGTPVLYGPFDNPGIVTFPSFHACMALLVGYGLRDDPVLRWPAMLYAALTLVSTVPIGGHYVADVLVGSAIFAACARLQSSYRPRTAPPLT